MKRCQHIEHELIPLRKQLNEHLLYKTLNSLDDIKHFMESHVFAVWDFMSLLKALQNELTTTHLPWVPVQNATTARLILEQRIKLWDAIAAQIESETVAIH